MTDRPGADNRCSASLGAALRAPKQPVERLLVARFHDIRQEDKAQITVKGLRPRRIGQGLLADSLDSPVTRAAALESVGHVEPSGSSA